MFLHLFEKKNKNKKILRVVLSLLPIFNTIIRYFSVIKQNKDVIYEEETLSFEQ